MDDVTANIFVSQAYAVAVGGVNVFKVSSGIMQDKIKSIVEGCPDAAFKFVKKEGIDLYFENEGDAAKAAATAKAAIKADPMGKTLLISVKPV